MPRLPPFPEHIAHADIDWRDNTPRSRTFDDVYFSVAGGVAEATHVFIDGNELPARFARADCRTFTIAETGFGTGLNFLLAASAFLAHAAPQATLHFVSVEKFPLMLADLQRAHAQWPELATLADELRAVLPPACSGFHRRTLCRGRIRLTLLLGDAAALLPRLDARVDAWFLDGFAPAKNVELWSAAVLAQVSRLSAADATYATFTSAGTVKRELRTAGFSVRKAAGHGSKWHMLHGRVRAPATATEAPANAATQADAALGATKKPATAAMRTAAIIGGGLAGCASARALAERGWQVTIFERNAELASETSGNLAGAVYPKFSAHETAQNRWYRDSYLFALSRLPQILGTADGIAWSACGLLQLQETPDNNVAERWPADVLFAIPAADASQRAGVASAHGGLWFPGAAWVHPPALCHALANHPNIVVRTHTPVTSLLSTEEPVQESPAQAVPGAANPSANAGHIRVNHETFSVAIIANALAANQFVQTASLPLRRVRGQVTHVAITPASANLRAIVCHEGYITPARDGVHCVGATFAPRDHDASVRADDHAENLANLAAACPEIYQALGGQHCVVTGGRTGFRTQTPDYLPVIGAVADMAALEAMPAQGITPRVENLYVLSALGAKGIAFSLLGAEIIAARINAEPLPVDVEVADALDPARFALRARRRAGTMATPRAAAKASSALTTPSAEISRPVNPGAPP